MTSEADNERDREQGYEQLANLARALEHPLRARMFRVLGQSGDGVPGLAEALGISLAEAAYHYGILESAGGLPADPETQG